MHNQHKDKKRVALVTGGNRGIGFEIARKLAARDIAVLIGARNREQGLQAQERLKREGLDVDFTALDVTDALSIQAAVGRIRDNFRRLDILVNNAGIMVDAMTGITELNVTILQNTLETNAVGPLLLGATRPSRWPT